MIDIAQVDALLRALRAEKNRLDRVIATLQTLEAAPSPARGPKDEIKSTGGPEAK